MTVETALKVATLRNVYPDGSFGMPANLREQALAVLAAEVERLTNENERLRSGEDMAGLFNGGAADIIQTLAVVRAAYGWTIGDDGRVCGLVAGDQGYADTCIVIPEVERLRENHCRDCCCAQAWQALGVEGYTGKSIPEHIEALRTDVERLRATVGDVWDAAFEASADGEGAKAEGASLGDAVRNIVRALRECRADLAVLNAQVDYIMSCRRDKTQNPGDDLLALQADLARVTAEANAREEAAFLAGLRLDPAEFNGLTDDEVAEVWWAGKDGAR